MSERERELKTDLTPKEQAFCELYLSNGNATKSAKEANISRATAKNYLKKENVKAYISGRQREIISECRTARNAVYLKAIRKLEKIIEDDSNQERQLRAINTYLRYCSDFKDVQDVEEEDDIEEANKKYNKNSLWNF